MLSKTSGTGFGALLATRLAAPAQTFHNAAGGPTDVPGRVVGQRMSEILASRS